MTWFHASKDEWQCTAGIVRRKYMYDGDETHAIYYALDNKGAHLGASHSLGEAKELVEELV